MPNGALVRAAARCNPADGCAARHSEAPATGEARTQNRASWLRREQEMMNDAITADVRRQIEELDIEYQLAVKHNDTETMDRILADDFVLVTGRGKVFTKEDLLAEAREQTTDYERQDDSERTVRVWGDTAVITALLWEKGTRRDGETFDKKLWFSDVYKLTPDGWKYVFAQASIPL